MGEKAAARQVLAETTLPKYLAFLELLLTQNGSTGFYVGDSLTIADIAMWRLCGWLSVGVLDGIPADILEAYPQVDQAFKAVGEIEGIKEWMESPTPRNEFYQITEFPCILSFLLSRIYIHMKIIRDASKNLINCSIS